MIVGTSRIFLVFIKSSKIGQKHTQSRFFGGKKAPAGMSKGQSLVFNKPVGVGLSFKGGV